MTFIHQYPRAVGQVIFGLSIVRAELAKGLQQEWSVEGVTPGVDLGNLLLVFAGVLLFNNSFERAIR